jgi:uncharacterized membrane protein YoaK (UPF0700 family)
VLEQTHKNSEIIRLEWTLHATAFAAGAVDIIGFSKLGGVFASAMTGNLALLAYHVAQGNSRSAIGSVIALTGFIAGCVVGFKLRRGRPAARAIDLLLSCETVLLLVAAGIALACCAAWSAWLSPIATLRVQILILAIAMGLQAVVGQLTSLSTIVFTTTLTRLVGGVYEAVATGRTTGLKDIGTQIMLLAAYVAGALLAGLLAVNDFKEVVFVPPTAVLVALAANRLLKRSA